LAVRSIGCVPSSEICAPLGLLGLIVAFSFSMAIGRFDQRKNYDAQEANAIGTEYVRAALLPSAEAETVARCLKEYLDQRIAFYETRNEVELRRIAVIYERIGNPAIVKHPKRRSIRHTMAEGARCFCPTLRTSRFPEKLLRLFVKEGDCPNGLCGNGNRCLVLLSAAWSLLPWRESNTLR
jgi:hypothetical protein